MAENTFFGDVHKELDAKMIPCGKWNMPSFYPGGSAAEHRHTRSGASIFDRTMVRCFQIAGKDCAAVLDKMFLRPVKDMPVSGCRENALLYENGTVAMLFTLCRMQEDDFMLLSESGIPEKAFAYFSTSLSASLEVRELSGAMAQLALIGSKSAGILQSAGAENLPANGRWQMISLKDDEGDEFRCIALCGEFAGEISFHLCCNAQYALEVYGILYGAGAAPAGVNAWESLRIESGIPGFPNELHDDFQPEDCGLINWVDLKREFSGKSALSKSEKHFRLWDIELDRHPALPGTVIELPGGIAAGVVTSSVFCPSSGRAQAICRMDENCGIKAGDTVNCIINGKNTGCSVIGESRR